MKPFPFTIHCRENYHTPFEFRDTWLKIKPAKLTWYAFSVVVESPTQVEFIVFDMKDSYFGGIGNRIGTFKATVSPDVTRKSIIARAAELAADKREKELEAIEARIVGEYTQAILSEIYP